MSIDIASVKHLKPLWNTGNIPREEPWRYDGFKTESKVLPKGHKKREDARAFPEAVHWDRDQPVKLRDGITIYCDIFRPADLVDGKLPAILNWSPYGKNGSSPLNLQVIPFQACRPQSTRSDYESFEGLDPAEWCKRGYAIINADPRGCFDSEGDIRNMGTHEGQDGADLVEWIGSQKWCNGYVGLAGNSWLAIAQWWIAAEQPKYLAAIAP
jgi:putative CocE/NonD family hydrolase